MENMHGEKSDLLESTNTVLRKQYGEALKFSMSNCLDSDEVHKSQWLCSEQGVDDINTFLKNIKDKDFVLAECTGKVGKTEDANLSMLNLGLSLTDCYRSAALDGEEISSIRKYWISRLNLLRCKDRLETFLGINMGRFSVEEYSKFCTSPISESAISLAENGKIGALNLLFKRHPYSLASSMLHILSAIPETIPVQTYSQILPGRSPPSGIILRDDDWVETETMASLIGDFLFLHTVDARTENLLRWSLGLVWPSSFELSDWYKHRALEIDSLCGQLDNCLSLVDIAFRKGVVELLPFLEDLTYLHQLTYTIGGETNYMLSISSWEQLPDYEKFKMMLKGAEGEMMLGRLLESAIPFMQNRDCSRNLEFDDSLDSESFLVRWLREVAAENKMDICLNVIKEGCEGLQQVNGIFINETEAVEVALACIYSCTLLDCWNTMSIIVSCLPRRTHMDRPSMVVDDSSYGHSVQGFGSPGSVDRSGRLDIPTAVSGKRHTTRKNMIGDESNKLVCISEELDQRVKAAEGHIEAGRLLAHYQVPKPMSFFLSASLDEKNVKQLIRLLMSKFSRQQGRSDGDWTNLWNDMQCLWTKAFPFLDKVYMLTEFCRGLLKAGKFSLARNYLKGSGNAVLAYEKAENLVIQAAREYFFSASSLTASEIWKARECLYLFPDSDSVKAELDLIDALTKKLPKHGVMLLPMQFRQVGNPMEIITMVIANQTRSYLDVDELIDIGKLLGLKSQSDIAAIQEAVAREAAVTGDLQLAFELCIDLAKKGHGPIWDLASAISRGPSLENMDMAFRKKLLGFSLSHCDDESLGELLYAWKDISLQTHNEKLIASIGSNHSESLSNSSITLRHKQIICDDLDGSAGDNLFGGNGNKLDHVSNIKSILCRIVKDRQTDSVWWDHVSKDAGNGFLSSKLPWLFSFCMDEGCNEQGTFTGSDEKCCLLRLQAGLCILTWLTANNFVPSDGLIVTLAKLMIELATSREKQVIGCSIFLNLIDSFYGARWIEKQLKSREGYQEAYIMMNIGMMYSSLHSSAIEFSSPSQRRKLLSHAFQERNWVFDKDDVLKINGIETQFWREWSAKLEEQRMLAEQARELERMIPGVDTARFFSGDRRFIEDVILSFVDSVKFEKKHILKDAVRLADTYGLQRTMVLVRYLRCTLVSLIWSDDEILSEVSDFKDDVVVSAAEIISVIASSVYPEIDGLNKERLSYIYSILSACCSFLRRTQDLNSIPLLLAAHEHELELFQFYKILEQECRKTSFIADLNFKNIANLHDLSFEHFSEEVFSHVLESTVDILADTVQVLVSIYDDPQARGLISKVDVFRCYILNELSNISAAHKSIFYPIAPSDFLNFTNGVQNCYEKCKVYMMTLPEEELLCMLHKFCILCIPASLVDSPVDSLGRDCLVELLNFWIKLHQEFSATIAGQHFEGMKFSSGLSEHLVAFRDLVLDGEVSPTEGWNTLSSYCRFSNCLSSDILLLGKSMVVSGCSFKVVANIFLEVKCTISLNQPHTEDLIDLYLSTVDFILNEVINIPENQHNLHKLLSSLSKFVDYRPVELHAVRHQIWEKLTAFSENMQLAGHFRVYLLELMQFILGRKGSSDDKFPDIFIWEEWDDPTAQHGTTENAVVSSRLTSNLVALKSNQLVSTISLDLKISSEDLGTIESATACYMLFLEAASSEQDFEMLQAILEEWETLFLNQIDDLRSPRPIEEQNTCWSSDEWGKGWEEDEPVQQAQQGFLSVHPLHVCWMKTIKKLIIVSQAGVVIKVMDRSLAKPQLPLLTRNEAEELLKLFMGIDTVLCLKIMLLLPYEDLWFQSLSSLEKILKQGNLHNVACEDTELLMLILSSGLLSLISRDPSYSKLFTCICYVIGHLSCRSQEDLLKHHISRSSKSGITASLFCRLLLPCFISELIISGKYLLAGHIVSRWMHSHASFRLLNVVECSLRKYLEGLLQSQQIDEYQEEKLVPHCTLVHTSTNLSMKLGNLLQTSLSALNSIS